MASSNTPRRRLRRPPTLKGKTNFVHMPLPEKLSLGGFFMTAQAKAEAPLGELVEAESEAIEDARGVLTKKLAEQKELQDALRTKDAEVIQAVQHYEVTLTDYTRGAVKAAKGDVLALMTLGVTPTATSRSKTSGPPNAPQNLRLSPGLLPGSIVIKHSRPRGAGSFAVEYKLEPSSPDDPWIAPESLQSSSAVQQLGGLPPAQIVKVRVRALGDGWGPYSVEVLGRAL